MSNLAPVLAVLAVMVNLAIVSPALADQRDDRLPDLFDQLKQAQNPATSQVIENVIWTIWMESGQNSINILMRQGIQDMQNGDYEAALGAFTAITELEPEFAEGWNKRATVLYLMGDYNGSVADIRRTLALEPRHFGALSGLGLIYDALEQEEAALKAYEAALDVHPNLPTPQQRVEELKKLIEGRRI